MHRVRFEPQTPVKDDLSRRRKSLNPAQYGHDHRHHCHCRCGRWHITTKFIRGKKNKDEDLDFYDDEDYQEEPYVNEDAEPDITEDDEAEMEDKE